MVHTILAWCRAQVRIAVWIVFVAVIWSSMTTETIDAEEPSPAWQDPWGDRAAIRSSSTRDTSATDSQQTWSPRSLKKQTTVFPKIPLSSKVLQDDVVEFVPAVNTSRENDLQLPPARIKDRQILKATQDTSIWTEGSWNKNLPYLQASFRDELPLQEGEILPLVENFVSSPSECPPFYVSDVLCDPQLSSGCIDVSPDPCLPRWFSGASGLVMTRTLPPGVATSRIGTQSVLFTNNAAATWPGGVDLHVGRRFGDQHKHAFEAIYWGVYNLGSSGQVSSATNSIAATPTVVGVTLGGIDANLLLSTAGSQQISRSDLVNDVEFNWIYAPQSRGTLIDSRQRRISLAWLAGFRFFQLQDQLIFQSTSSSGSILLNLETNNLLYGGQLGAQCDWNFLPTMRFAIVPKFMLAGNSIASNGSLGSTSGVPATETLTGAAMLSQSKLGTFSYLGSLDTGVAWDINPRWTISAGYRIVGVGHVALADQSWPTVIDTPTSLSSINSTGSSLIHGAFAGFEAHY